MARQRSRGFVRAARPPGAWAGAAVAPFTLAANTKVLVTALVPEIGPTLTVRRIRLGFSVVSDQLAATESYHGAVGAAVLNDTSIAAGVASLPDPLTDIGDDIWMLYQAFGNRFLFGDATGFQDNAAMWFDVDSKAMRKLPHGKSVAIIVASGTVSNGMLFGLTVRSYATFARG